MHTEESGQVEATKQLVVRSLSIESIVKEYENIKNQIDESNGEASNELQAAHDYIMDLMSNKVDDIVELHGLLERRVDTLKAQIKKTEKDLETLEYWSAEAMKQMKLDEMNGEFNRLSFRSSSAVLVSDEKAIPNNCKKIRVEISQDVDVDNERVLAFWKSVILQRKITLETPVTPEEQLVLDKAMTVVVKKDEIKKLLKIGAVPGARLEDRRNIQFQPGKAKVKVTKKAKEVKEVLNESNG